MPPSPVTALPAPAAALWGVAVSLLLTAWAPPSRAAQAASATPPPASAAAPGGAGRPRRDAVIEARLAQLRAELSVNLAAQRSAHGAAIKPLRQREQRLRAQMAELAAQLAALPS